MRNELPLFRVLVIGWGCPLTPGSSGWASGGSAGVGPRGPGNSGLLTPANIAPLTGLIVDGHGGPDGGRHHRGRGGGDDHVPREVNDGGLTLLTYLDLNSVSRLVETGAASVSGWQVNLKFKFLHERPIYISLARKSAKNLIFV